MRSGCSDLNTVVFGYIIIPVLFTNLLNIGGYFSTAGSLSSFLLSASFLASLLVLRIHNVQSLQRKGKMEYKIVKDDGRALAHLDDISTSIAQ